MRRHLPRVARIAVVAALVVAALRGAQALGVMDQAGELAATLRDAGPLGMVAYGVVYVVAVVLLVPKAILAAVAGFAYGPAGVLLAWPIGVVGATAAFLLARTVARRWVERRVARDRRFALVDRVAEEGGWRLVLLLRLSPAFPYNLLNYALGLTRVRPRDFVVASSIGIFPLTAIWVYVGTLATPAGDLGVVGLAPPPGVWGQAMFWAGVLVTAAATVFVVRLSRRLAREPAAPTGEPRP